MGQFVKYLMIWLVSMVKFIGGPVFAAGANAAGANINFLESVAFTTLGMMTSVALFSFAGEKLREWYFKKFRKNKTLFTKRNRRIIKIWKSYGLTGVAFLTPLLFTPIGGTLIASSFGESRYKIFLFMGVSALFWASVFSYFLVVLPQHR